MIEGPEIFCDEDVFYEVYSVDSLHQIKVISSKHLEGSGQWCWSIHSGDALIEAEEETQQGNFATHVISLYQKSSLIAYRINQDGSIPHVSVYINP